MKNKHIGSNFDDFLREEGILAEVESAAIKEILSQQIRQLMKDQNLSKSEMSHRMGTSRASLNRLLNPKNTSVSLKTISIAALSLGKKVNIQLI